MTRLRIRATSAYYIRGGSGGLLVDTGYAGTLPAFYRAIGEKKVALRDIDNVMATHYHPDHAGLIGSLTGKGVKLLLIDRQKDAVHFPDGIFARDGIPYEPVREEEATVVAPEESRAFLVRLGISGRIVPTPSHSRDSVSLILDDGDAFVGDLEPLEYLAAYEENAALKEDWDRVLSFRPKRIFYAHAPERILPETGERIEIAR